MSCCRASFDLVLVFSYRPRHRDNLHASIKLNLKRKKKHSIQFDGIHIHNGARVTRSGDTGRLEGVNLQASKGRGEGRWLHKIRKEDSGMSLPGEPDEAIFFFFSFFNSL